jgi:uncharacterized protein YdiU (UPF0061 family)
MLQSQEVDFTLAWCHLADAAEGHEAPLKALFSDTDALAAWLSRWRGHCAQQDARNAAMSDTNTTRRNDGVFGTSAPSRAAAIRAVNPWIIPRNQRVEEALTAASQEDLSPFERLLAALQRPYGADGSTSVYAQPAPAEVTERYRTFCGT